MIFEPRWDRDLERGKQGEMFADAIAKMSRDGSGQVEVKTDAWWLITGRLFVERECLKRGKYEPSGLETTKALFWTFVAGRHQVELTLSTEHLRRAVAYAVAHDPRNREAECSNGSHPTRGAYVYMHDIQASRDCELDEHAKLTRTEAWRAHRAAIREARARARAK